MTSRERFQAQLDRCCRIKTVYNPKPIPDLRFDWDAWQPDNYDLGSPTGYGPTEEEAIKNLLEQLEEK
jgi:hypothetical protein